MNKRQRQALILSIITEGEVETQQELQILLKERGCRTTQATVSRDMREMHIAKRMSENGVSSYFSDAVGKTPEYNSIFAQAVISLDYAMNTVVIKCRAGLANAACAVLDEQQFGFVVGTIAGDDTIFVLTRTENSAVQLIELLRRMMSE